MNGANRVIPEEIVTRYPVAPILTSLIKELIMKKHTTKDLPQARLKELLHYCPETGVFTWKVNANSRWAKVGDIAGTTRCDGYQSIRIEGKSYYSHRLAFLYMEGFLPEFEVDHVNRDASDNRWSNLRHISHKCNIINSKIQSNNTSGVTGVKLNSRDNRWYARIYIDKKEIFIASCKDLTDAVKARWEAEKEYNFPNCNSTSSAFLYLRKIKPAGRNPETPC